MYKILVGAIVTESVIVLRAGLIRPVASVVCLMLIRVRFVADRWRLASRRQKLDAIELLCTSM